MQRLFVKAAVAAGMLLGLPLCGIMFAGYPVDRYLEFPPESNFLRHAPYSSTAFVAYALFILLVTTPLIKTAIQALRRGESKSKPKAVFPWWGWMGIGSGICFWVLAWSRYPWFAGLQPHTFPPLWFSYILVVNGLCYRQSGGCMMTDRRGYFISLFPASALFWWFFEYLNRFVQNWHYAGVHFSPSAYFWLATLSFSTVLPAVLGTRDLLLHARWLQIGFKPFAPLRYGDSRLLAVSVLLGSGLGLTGIGVFPDLLFPLVWVSPLLILLALQVLTGGRHLLQALLVGDWRLVIASAVAALICGFFWEMWNYHSLARWVYTIPFVDRYPLFEMPILGYAGYLPFGVVCTLIGEEWAQLFRRHPLPVINTPLMP